MWVPKHIPGTRRHRVAEDLRHDSDGMYETEVRSSEKDTRLIGSAVDQMTPVATRLGRRFVAQTPVSSLTRRDDVLIDEK